LKKGRERVDESQLFREEKRPRLTSVTMNAIHIRKLNPPNTKLRAFFQYMVFGVLAKILGEPFDSLRFKT
jgi:hypothetical protein